MKYLNKETKLLYLFIVFSFFLMLPPSGHAMHRISLEVDIDIDRSQIKGISKMAVNAGEEVVLLTGSLRIDEIRIDSEPAEYDEFDGTIKVLPKTDGELTIHYTGVFKEMGLTRDVNNPVVENVIDERGASLTNIWYPTHGELSMYDLKATLPPGYNAISEADQITKTAKNGKTEYHFRFPYRVDSINLIASNKYVITKDEFRDIEIYAYFFSEDTDLAKTYIEYTKKYLEMYENMVGMYPYRRFSIVENFLPTGYSMPTYTLLGNTVVKLPFIVKTSLGHEILHQWFGNSVYIDYESGNWAEGLTTYLADHHYKKLEGEGWKYRKQILVDYRTYVDIERDVPLKFFTRRVDRPSRAMGYGKVAMVFHMLKNMVGKETFFASLKDFIEKNRFKKASWNDIKLSFEKNHGAYLDWYFNQWVEKEGLPDLDFHGVAFTQEGSAFKLHFHVDLQGDVFRFRLPVTIYFRDKVLFDSVEITGAENSFDLMVPAKPHRIVLDEDYDIARGITLEEFPPIIGRLLSDDKKILAVPYGGGIYKSAIDYFETYGAAAKDAAEITMGDIEEKSIIILSVDNPVARRLFGSIPAEDAGFSFTMKNNPWNPEKVVAVIQGRAEEEVEAAIRKISHYGKYSKLLFNKGVNRGKEIQETKRGMVMELDHEARAIEISSVRTLSGVIKGIEDRRIIYVGEVHDVFAHHAVQLDIITSIYKKHPNMAIGMEMFQRPFQKTLDGFVEGSIPEEEFLKTTEYFKRWGFDYNLYKPILDFAKAEKVPVIALNLEREIVTAVGHSGIDSLSDEEKKKLPAEMDFSDSEYRARLKEIFSLHKDADKKNFDYFFQSQILWDETMSRSVDEYMKNNPESRMVVLAGQGHLRYGSGIPKRTYRRNGLDYAIVLIDEEVEKDIADYVVFPKPVEGITTPKLMVFLDISDDKMKVTGFPENSVSEEAGMKEGDFILFLDDIEIKDIEDIKLFLFYKRKGDVIKARISREEEDGKKKLEIDIKL